MTVLFLFFLLVSGDIFLHRLVEIGEFAPIRLAKLSRSFARVVLSDLRLVVQDHVQ